MFIRIGGRTLPHGEERTPHEEVGKMRRAILLVSVAVLVLASCGEDTEGGGSQATTPAASASPSTEPSPSGPEADDFVGSWRGTLYEPDWDATWSLRATIRQCDPGHGCGRLRLKTPYSGYTDGPLSCEGTLSYEGTEDNAFVFDEIIEDGICVNARMLLTPLPSGHAFGVERYYLGSSIAYGFLLLEHYFPGGL
jgi:hypothetical protein